MITLAFADDSIFQHALLKIKIRKDPRFRLDIFAFDGLELIEKLEQANEIPDVCILDLQMPELNGIETAQRLTHRFPKLLLFGWTTCHESSKVTQMLASGVLEVFAKEDVDSMFRAIEEGILSQQKNQMRKEA
ncbi:response regulator [Siphonobacter sp. SORGH_AS_0500]|uniref:response regulator n=1 Tax=Siphonobacter sp. SORGH_AS_0500 TaxID=1864824 RepID=UPI000CAA870A|nr:response regulator [Siphonobacter sp. SORGH_AS_0500]MDR6196467.1 chemotaxis response regulator CheB [Siphonobacter sp. SORGH_AS_0500]PKK37626.1 hypothetical protein BWI96_03910 [Siphonobacter sp. SORGH_AS_0500]